MNGPTDMINSNVEDESWIQFNGHETKSMGRLADTRQIP